jgi:site-specific recombinase XerD
MLELARSVPRDYALLRLLRFSLRIGEVVGNDRLHGIRSEDLRDNGIWIKGKGGSEQFVTIKKDVLKDLEPFKRGRLGERIFPMSERNAEYLVKDYARRAGVEDWEYVSPHRLRAFFATDLKDRGKDGFTIKELMRHKSIRTTEIYVGPPTRAQQEAIIESLS